MQYIVQLCILVSITLKDSAHGYDNTGVSAELSKCDNGSEASVGLWLDVVTFALVVLQILILDTRYSDQVRQRIIDIEETGEK